MLQGPEIVSLIGLAIFASTSFGYYDEYGEPDKFESGDASLTEQLDQFHSKRNPFLAFRYFNDMAIYTEIVPELLPEMLPTNYGKELRASVMTTETDETVPEFMFDILSNFDSIKLNKNPSRRISDSIAKVNDDAENDGKETTIRWVVFPKYEEDKWFYYKSPTRTKISYKSEKPPKPTDAMDSTNIYQFITSDDTHKTKTFVKVVNESENSDPESYQFITSEEYFDTRTLIDMYNESEKPHPTVSIDSSESHQYRTLDENPKKDIIIDIVTDFFDKKELTVIQKLPKQMEDVESNTIVSPTRTRLGVKNSSTTVTNLLNVSNKLLFNIGDIKEKKEYKAVDRYRITRTPYKFSNLREDKETKAMDGYRITISPKKFRNLKENNEYKAIDSYLSKRTQKKLRRPKTKQKIKAINKIRNSKIPKKLKGKKGNVAINGYRKTKNQKQFRKKQFEALNVYSIFRNPNNITTTLNRAYTRKKKEYTNKETSPKFTRTVEYEMLTPVRTKTRDGETSPKFTRTVEYEMLTPVRTKTRDKVHSNKLVRFDDHSTTLTDYDESQATVVYREHKEPLLSKDVNTKIPNLTFSTAKEVRRTQIKPVSSENTNTETPTLTSGTAKVVTRSQFEPLPSETINTETPTLSFGTAKIVTRSQFEPLSSENTNTETFTLPFGTTEEVTRTQFEPMFNEEIITEIHTLIEPVSSENTNTETLTLTVGTTKMQFEPVLNEETNTETPTVTIDEAAVVSKQRKVISSETSYTKNSGNHYINPSVIIAPLNYPENIFIKQDNIESASFIPILDTLFTATESVFDDSKILPATEQWLIENDPITDTDDNPTTPSQPTPTDYLENDGTTLSLIIPSTLTDYLDVDGTTPSLISQPTSHDDSDEYITTPNLISESTTTLDSDDDDTTLNLISESTTIVDSDDDGTVLNLNSETTSTVDSDDDGTTQTLISQSTLTDDLDADSVTLNLISESTTTVDSDDDGTTQNLINQSTTTDDSDDDSVTLNLTSQTLPTDDLDNDNITLNLIGESTTIDDSDVYSTTPNLIIQTLMIDDLDYDSVTLNLISKSTTIDGSKTDWTTPSLLSRLTTTDNITNVITTPGVINKSSEDYPNEVSTDLIRDLEVAFFSTGPYVETIMTQNIQSSEKVETSFISSHNNVTTTHSAKSPLRQGEAYWEAKILEGRFRSDSPSFNVVTKAGTEQSGYTPSDYDGEENEPSTLKTLTRPNRNPARVDINKLLARIKNVIESRGDKKSIYDRLNDTFHRKGIVTMDFDTTTLSSNLTGTIMGKCFVCGLNQKDIPRNASCGDAFAGDFIPLVPVDPRARSQIHKFRKYCRWKDIPKYVDLRDRNIWGRWTGGCSVRWVDLSGLYTERSCRNRHRATLGISFASKRMAKLEMSLQHLDNGCIMSPVASLVPMSRGISLYARFFACVCTGNWCNRAVHFALQSPHVAFFTILGLTLEYFVGIG